jgi:quercetin dioxygenase-like cupin family protein
MTIKLVALVLLCLMTGTAVAQEPKVTSLMSKDLPENPGREALMITVEHAPGGSSAIHRHNAHAFVYVLEGSVVMQLKGGQQVTLTAGQTFYEGPDDVHVVDRNKRHSAGEIPGALDQGQGRPGGRAGTVTVG